MFDSKISMNASTTTVDVQADALTHQGAIDVLVRWAKNWPKMEELVFVSTWSLLFCRSFM